MSKYRKKLLWLLVSGLVFISGCAFSQTIENKERTSISSTGFEDGDVRNLGNHCAIFYQNKVYIAESEPTAIYDEDIKNNSHIRYLGKTFEVSSGVFHDDLDSYRIVEGCDVFVDDQEDILYVQEYKDCWYILKPDL